MDHTLRSKAYKPPIRLGLNLMIWTDKDTKAECDFPMVISSDLRMGQHRDDDHQEDAPHFTLNSIELKSSNFLKM